ncbi:bifunctional hydroxymethylpyrimidine kinase/phosphomethylpyrimidine kinase [Corynebacterium sp. 4HC-13]|uniref:Thiamine biosynthesis multifunctional protein ThiED n=1 Tax=Corynebacterium anserum TaxID=2684406 RepID=A0A7G7YM95_9CORY|nr:bifunctional hydroxymethylpyrimidine kinase/phosphomethylpyrimidine kinase [Corynebacterium anserum]MBC2680971.1 bifunctional hydroxymethylpyrimidine kinase/phosphomethylpyrimidine kinase [Corynebacterium anserum]QNH95615.1 bifunctional hydroxymethylpyrimidine kinase/phosphomethylpyrimidine kinase [Corynebacterium anserum]
MNISASTSASCPRVLSIAGTDPSGGAGIQADLKSIGAAGGYGMSVTTALVAQNTQGVRSIHIPPQSFLTEQLAAVFDDVTVDAVKVGMLGDATTVATVSDWLDKHPVPVVVVDPVMVATSGDRLLTEEAEEAVRRFVANHATVVTPNLLELAVLLNTEPATSMDETIEQARTLARDVDVAVLAKGGHLTEDRADNALILPDGSVSVIPVPRVETNNTHGTGCSLSSALATRLSGGDSPAHAVEWATRWLRESIEFADELQVGRGNGPIDHFHRMRKLSRAGSAVPWFDQMHAAEHSDTGGGNVQLNKPTISPAGTHTEELWESVSSDIWPEILDLSFIRALGEGTLHTADFAFYLNQDSLYLREYSRALAGLSTRASNPEEQVFWAKGAAGALVEEAEMHRTWLANNSVTLSAHPSPVTKAYTDHLIASVLSQDYVVGVAAVLPCYWLYAEIGAVLHAKNHPGHPYSLWLATYADEEFAQATQSAIQWMEQALEKATEEQRRAARKAFIYASIHEREFFDQAYRAW